MVIALPRLQTATTKRCENASASVKLNYRSLPVGPRVVRMIDVSTYEGADFMGDRLRHVGSAVPRTSGLAEPSETCKAHICFLICIIQARVQEFVRGGAQNLKAFFFFFFLLFNFSGGGAQLRN